MGFQEQFPLSSHSLVAAFHDPCIVGKLPHIRLSIKYSAGNNDCSGRQFLFYKDWLIEDIVCGAGANGPVITFVVQQGVFRRQAKDMKIDPNMQPQLNGVTTLYTTYVQAFEREPKKGIYYAKIHVIGRPRKFFQSQVPCPSR